MINVLPLKVVGELHRSLSQQAVQVVKEVELSLLQPTPKRSQSSLNLHFRL